MNLDLLPDRIKINKRLGRNILDKMTKPVIYSPSAYGITNRCTGKGVRIALLDSGCPMHKDIKVIGEKMSLCDENINTSDKNGHATAVSGIINSNNKKSIVGLAPNAEVIYGKIVDNYGLCSFNSLVTGVLWSVVKEADIIVIALGSQYDHMVLHDAIKKASEHGICIFAAAGDTGIDKEWEMDYPAKYDRVFSAGYLKRVKAQSAIIREKVDFSLPNRGLYTTYLNDTYVKMSGSSISTAFFAGLAAVLVEQYKQEKRKNVPKMVYAKLKSVFG